RRQKRAVDIAIDLLARPGHVVPKEEGVADVDAQPTRHLVADADADFGDEGKLVPAAQADVAGQCEQAAGPIVDEATRPGVGRVALEIDRLMGFANGDFAPGIHAPGADAVLTARPDLAAEEFVAGFYAVGERDDIGRYYPGAEEAGLAIGQERARLRGA